MQFFDSRMLLWAAISAVAIVAVGIAIGVVIARRAKVERWYQYVAITAVVLFPVSWGVGFVCWHVAVNCGGSAMNSGSVGTLVSHGNEVDVSTTLWRTVLYVEYLRSFSMLLLVLSVTFILVAGWWHSRRS